MLMTCPSLISDFLFLVLLFCFALSRHGAFLHSETLQAST